MVYESSEVRAHIFFQNSDAKAYLSDPSQSGSVGGCTKLISGDIQLPRIYQASGDSYQLQHIGQDNNRSLYARVKAALPCLFCSTRRATRADRYQVIYPDRSTTTCPVVDLLIDIWQNGAIALDDITGMSSQDAGQSWY